MVCATRTRRSRPQIRGRSHIQGGVAATSLTTYDRLSRPDVVTWTGERQGSVDYTYDALGRTTRITAAGPAGETTTTATFDKASSPLTITLQALGMTATTTNTFAKTGQWRTTSATGGKTWEFASATDGTLRRVAARPATPYGPPLAARNLSYDTALRLVQLQLSAGSTTTASESLTYDTYGRVASTKMVSSASALTADQSYTYDAAGRLATWTLAGATTTYTHDDAGNLTVIDRPGTTTDLTMAYGLDNELLTSKLGAYTTTYTNDTYGRRTRSSSTAAGVATYTWDNVGQLAQVTKAGYRYAFAYGPTGMRERVTATSLASGAVTSTTESVWEGGRLALERVTDSTGVSTYRYVYGPGSLPLELIVTEQGGTPVSYAYLCDRAGSVVGLTDSNGAVVATYRYDPWGAPTGPAPTGIGAQPAPVPWLLPRRRDRPLLPPGPLLRPGRRAVPEPGPGSSECRGPAFPQPLRVLRGGSGERG